MIGPACVGAGLAVLADEGPAFVGEFYVGVPRPFALFAKGRASVTDARSFPAYYRSIMPKGLRRFYGAHHLHFITCSCYRRQPILGPPQRRDLFLTILEQVRQRYRFVVEGYVVMPEHFIC